MRYISDYRAIVASIDNHSLRWNGFLPKGTPVVVTYSFADGRNVPTVGESAFPVTGTAAFNATQRQNFREAIKLFEAVAGITFVEINEGGMIDASAAQGSGYGGWAEIAEATQTRTNTGFLVIDQNNNYDQGTYGFFVVMHEIGHALGLEHPFDGSLRLQSTVDIQSNTVMTYNAQPPFAVDLGRFDKQALQDLYGDRTDVSDWDISYNNVRKVMSISAGNSDDTLLGVAGKNRLKGGSGDDTVYGREDDDFLRGQAGNDRLVGMAGKDTLYGDTGADVLIGDIDAKGNSAGAADFLYGGFGNDRLFGGSGQDQLYGGKGRDFLSGGNAADLLYGGETGDVLRGGSGDDSLFGEDGNDRLRGDTGNDYLDGGDARDVLHGNGGNDHLIGGQGLDILFGGYGRDTLDGGKGRDTLNGQYGNDVLIGGAKADVFVFDAATSRDRIMDFEDGLDRMSLVGFSFGDLNFSARGGGADALITVDGLNVRIYLENVTVAELDASDFI